MYRPQYRFVMRWGNVYIWLDQFGGNVTRNVNEFWRD